MRTAASGDAAGRYIEYPACAPFLPASAPARLVAAAVIAAHGVGYRIAPAKRLPASWG